MNYLNSIASAGVWPSLPVLGWFLVQKLQPPGLKDLPAVTRFAVYCVIGIVLWSVPMLILAIFRVYLAWIIGAAGWLIVIMMLPYLWKGRSHTPDNPTRLDRWDYLLVFCMVAIVYLYCGYPNESMLDDSDPAVYANHAVWIAHHGRLDVQYAWSADIDTLFSDSFKDFLGLYHTPGTMTVQFAHLFPVWLAQAYSSFGYAGLLSLNGIFGILSILILWGVLRRAVTPGIALVAVLFLALSPGQMWLARITLTEILTQVFTWTGVLLLVSALRLEDIKLGWIAGAIIAFAALVRIDSLLLLPLLVIADIIMSTLNPEQTRSRVWKSVYQTSVPLFCVATGYYAFFSSPYFADLSRQLIMIGAFAAAAFAMLAVCTRPVRRYGYRLISSNLFLLTAGYIILTLILYAYLVRPHLPPFGAVHWPGHPLNGTRDYREDSLRNLTLYLSPVTVALALYGYLRSWYGTIRKHEFSGVIVVAKKLNIPIGTRMTLITPNRWNADRIPTSPVVTTTTGMAAARR